MTADVSAPAAGVLRRTHQAQCRGDLPVVGEIDTDEGTVRARSRRPIESDHLVTILG